MSSSTPAQPKLPLKGCHNCRRRRLRCDRSYPSCHKCSVTGEQCLGYGIILRWANAPAVRGKLAKQTRRRERPTSHTPGALVRQETSLVPALLDPVLDHLSHTSRRYIHHFATEVCRDLVSHDQNARNPFRIMIPLIQEVEYLQAIVIATSALHISVRHRNRGQPVNQELVDALSAKDKAIRLLHSAIDRATPASQTTILTAIVFFVNLDLIESGKGVWDTHIKAAEILISSLHRPGEHVSSPLTPLADAVAADCLTYRILGSTISAAGSTAGVVRDSIDVVSVLQRGETHSYHCCPPFIMKVILLTSQLFSANPPQSDSRHADSAASLLGLARSFDVRGWVYSIQGLSPDDDLEARVTIASAHRAGASLYIRLAASGPEDDLDSFPNCEELVLEILHHLSSIPIDHVLLKGTIWPTFMAAAQTNDPKWRSWCMDRLGAMYTANPFICPWGYIRTAMETLQWVWDSKADGHEGNEESTNWLHRLRTSSETCLIV